MTAGKTKKKVEVTLLGQRFTVRSERDEEYIHGLVHIVNHELEQLRRQTRMVSTHQLALLVTLNLAEQLQQCRAEIDTLKKEIREAATAALHQVNNALMHLPTEIIKETRPPIRNTTTEIPQAQLEA